MTICKGLLVLLALYAVNIVVSNGQQMRPKGSHKRSQLRSEPKEYQRIETPSIPSAVLNTNNKKHTSSPEDDNRSLDALKRLHSDVANLNKATKFDFSFDKSLHELKNCSGIALDPTVTHPIKMSPGVVFIKAGANSPKASPEWTSWSVPELKKWYGHPLYALKMDCEGCEYSLAQDILRDDPLFFNSVLQFNLEVHLPRTFANERDILNLGLLVRLMYESGMSLVHVDDEKCGASDQNKGCDAKLESIGFPCDPGCRSYLFSHKTTTYADWMAKIAGKRKTIITN